MARGRARRLGASSRKGADTSATVLTDKKVQRTPDNAAKRSLVEGANLSMRDGLANEFRLFEKLIATSSILKERAAAGAAD